MGRLKGRVTPSHVHVSFMLTTTIHWGIVNAKYDHLFINVCKAFRIIKFMYFCITVCARVCVCVCVCMCILSFWFFKVVLNIRCQFYSIHRFSRSLGTYSTWSEMAFMARTLRKAHVNSVHFNGLPFADHRISFTSIRTQTKTRTPARFHTFISSCFINDRSYSLELQ